MLVGRVLPHFILPVVAAKGTAGDATVVELSSWVVELYVALEVFDASEGHVAY